MNQIGESMFLESLVPLFAISFTLLAVMAIAVALIISNFKKRKLELDTYKAAIEKGLPVPEFKMPTKSPTGTLKAALIWIAGGIGFSLMMFADGDPVGRAFSSVPILIGIALIISYVIEKKEKAKERNNQ